MLTFLTVALHDLDLDGDWDPEAHDRQMAGIYAQDDGGVLYEEGKPIWDDDISIDDIVPPVASSSKKKEKKSKRYEKGGEDKEDGYYDSGYEAYGEGGEWDDEEWDGTEEMRKRKLQEYMDSLLELEFNDMASGTRLERDYRVS